VTGVGVWKTYGLGLPALARAYTGTLQSFSDIGNMLAATTGIVLGFLERSGVPHWRSLHSEPSIR
jgi:hypothetical protein